jgi:predicted enzyme related to lactoylglutathione lyase
MPRINFIELPARDLGAARTFYSAVFGWDLIEPPRVCRRLFGLSYAAMGTSSSIA